MNEKKIFVLDTNVIMHDSECIFSFQEHDVAIPIEVIMELDNHKKGTETTNYNAREFLRTIELMPREKIYDGGATLGEGLGTLRILVGYPYHGSVKKIFPELTMDHRILNAAYCLSITKKNKDQNIKVVLVSKDVNLRIKSGAIGLTAEDYKNDIVADANSLYKEVKKLLVPDTTIESLYSQKVVDLPETEKLFVNEFMILNSPSNKSALAVYKNGKANLITRDKLNPFGIKARNSEQAFALSALLDPDILLVALTGKAGTGKTLLSLAAGLQYLYEDKVNQIFFTREPIPLGRDTGFLPGDVDEKLSPFMQGLSDNLTVIENTGKNKETILRYKKDKKVVIEPISFIRGRSLIKKFFIIDEAQNSTPKEIKALVTRAGEDTKIILIGDITQIDSPYLTPESNGLSYLISRFSGQKIFSHITLIKGERSYLAELAGDLL